MIEALPDLTPPFLGFRASGTVTAEDYETVLMPALEAAVAEHGKIRVLYILEASVTDFSLGAMWDDAKTGVKHLTDFERIAVVSHNPLIRGTIRALHFAMPNFIEVFSLEDEEKALEWVTA